MEMGVNGPTPRPFWGNAREFCHTGTYFLILLAIAKGLIWHILALLISNETICSFLSVSFSRMICGHSSGVQCILSHMSYDCSSFFNCVLSPNVIHFACSRQSVTASSK